MQTRTFAMLTVLAIGLCSGPAQAVVPPPIRDLDACLAMPRSKGAAGCYQEATAAIDRFKAECLDTLYGPPAKVGCFATSEDYWDERLNLAYGLLMARLDQDAKSRLRTAQKQWLAYRDATEAAFQASFWGNEQAEKKLATISIYHDIVQQRTEMLERMLMAITADR